MIPLTAPENRNKIQAGWLKFRYDEKWVRRNIDKLSGGGIPILYFNSKPIISAIGICLIIIKYLCTKYTSEN